MDFFNDDTRPSRHINRHTHVDVFQSCFHFVNKLLKPEYYDIVQVLRLVEVNKLIASNQRDLAHALTPLAQTPWGLTGRTWLQAGAQWVVIWVLPPLNSIGIDSHNVGTVSSEELYTLSDRSYQIEFRFS